MDQECWRNCTAFRMDGATACHSCAGIPFPMEHRIVVPAPVLSLPADELDRGDPVEEECRG